MVLTEYVYVLARVAVADRQLFVQLVSATAAAQNVKETLVWEAILNQWWNRVRRTRYFSRRRSMTAIG